jgi:branched-chain amino acid transport system substrate-binding protein
MITRGFAFVIAASLTACAAIVGIESDPQVTAITQGDGKCTGTLHVRIASDFSGTTTDIAIPYHFGLYDYLRELNESGGLRGCPIDIQVADNGYDPKVTDDVVQRWRDTDPSWADVSTVFIFGTGPTTRVGPQLGVEKKVIIPGSYAGSLATPVPQSKDVGYEVLNAQFQTGEFSEHKDSPGWPYVFFPATDYGTAIRLGIQAVWTLAPGRMAMAHDTEDRCLYCTDPLAAGKSYLRTLDGMSVGRDLVFPQTSSEADEKVILDAVAAYFAQEADHVVADSTYVPVTWVWTGNSVFASSKLGKGVALAQQTLAADARIPAATRAKWKIRVMANNWGIGETTPTICGPTCNDIFYGLFPVPRYGDIENAGGMAALVALHDKYGARDVQPSPPMPARKPTDYRDVRYVQGYVAAAMWRRGMEAAIDAGHPHPSGEDLKTALEAFKQYALDGLTSGPISFTAQDHRPQASATVYKLSVDGHFQFVNKYSIGLIPSWLGY